MRTTNTIHCPNCRHEFEMSSVMRAELEAEVRATTAEDYEQKISEARAAADDLVVQAKRDMEVAAAKEVALLKQQRELGEREQRAALDFERRLADETTRIREHEASAAREKFEREADERVRAKDDELFEAQAKLATATARETELVKKERAISDKERALEIDVEQRVAEQTQRIRDQEAKAAKQKYARAADEQVRTKQTELDDAQRKLAASAVREAEWMKKERALADRERQMEVEKERAIAAETAKAREQEAKLFEERAVPQQEKQRLRDEEHRQKIAGLETTITELQRKVQQGSQQVQGEAQEVVLRSLLAEEFPFDSLEDVPNGTSGADVVHSVRSPNGGACGCIVWESKRTKNWSDTWLPKARDDQRLAGAAIAVIVTQALPGDVRHFGVKEGVWVCAPSHAQALGTLLRASLVDVALAKRTAEGSGQKMQILYKYLTGTEFRNNVEAVVEAFNAMRSDLDKERRATQSSWKRREKQMERALLGITSLHGDLQGIAGRDVLDLPSLEMDSPLALAEASDIESQA